MAPRIEDLTGKRYGRLTVMYQNGFRYKPSGQRNVLWHCKCDCGKEKDIPANTLRNGRSMSCGCLNSELASKRATVHGGCKGEKLESIYKIWRCMKGRCFQKSNNRYKDYGGRGIKICREWLDYSKFREWAISNGYKEGLSIDRIDVNGDYCPENCRWATAIEQANNKRNNAYITALGDTKTATEWSRATGIDASTILERIKSGWSEERAVSESIYSCKRMITWEGRTQSVADWARELGMKYRTLYERLKRNGWSPKGVIG